MYYLNKIVGAFLNPLGIGLVLLIASLICAILKRRHPTSLLPAPYPLLPIPSPLLPILLSLFWLWFWSTGAVGRWIGLSLEREFPPQLAEQMPEADAIVVLGGGTWTATNSCPYVELLPGADRAWHGARLYKAGKAPKVFVTCESDARVLADLGVPREVITVNDKARNTEEEARFVAGAMKGSREQGVGSRGQGVGNPKVLLVTSAWHMRRAKLMYEKYAKGVEVIPAATDHISTTIFDEPLAFKDFVPDPVMMGHNASMFKEWVGYYGYCFLRK